MRPVRSSSSTPYNLALFKSNEEGLCPIVTFNNEVAKMVLVNTDNPSETIEFTSPMRDLELKGANSMQSLGGVETYQTRYLYIQLLNIVESDSFDAVSGKDDHISENQVKRLYVIAKGKDFNEISKILELEEDAVLQLIEEYKNLF